MSNISPWQYLLPAPMSNELPEGTPLTFLRKIKWPLVKPTAFVTIDDRALTFDGTWPSFEFLDTFKPWNRQ